MSTGGPIKGNKKLHQEIEVEEIYDDTHEYTIFRDSCCQAMLNTIETFLGKKAERWSLDDEEKIIDILSLLNNATKAQLSSNNPKYMKAERERFI